jgi:hypothetical protein
MMTHGPSSLQAALESAYHKRCSVPVFEANLGSIHGEYRVRHRQPSWRSRLKAALMRARWVKACGKLPKASPEGPISSA